MTYPFECPYCKSENKYTGDCLGEDETTETECRDCGKKIEVTCSIHVTYRANCLESDHVYVPVKDMTGLSECVNCGDFKRTQT